MSASIWAPGNELVTIDAESTNLSQVFVATASQVVFTLTSFSYAVGTGSVAVYRGGQRLILGTDWTETTSTSISLSGFTIEAGEIIEVVAVLGSASSASIAAQASAVEAAASAAEAAASAAEAALADVTSGNVRTFTNKSFGDLVNFADTINLTGLGKRITGDFSNATLANRLMFQTSTVNGATNLHALPNGTGTLSSVRALNSSDISNYSIGGFVVNGSECILQSDKAGTGSYLPMTFHTGGTESFRCATDGTLTVSKAAGLGYGTGAGGTVTQATSKSTAVTLNKPTGRITMNNASLAANTAVGFTLNNSIIEVNDVVIVNHTGGGGISNYQLWAQPSAGAVIIYVKNLSAGSLSDALSINFAVIKGATA